MLALKAVGLIVVFSACTLAGFLKSVSISKRAKKLSNFYHSINALAEKIRIGSGEITYLVDTCFDKELCKTKDNKVIVDESYLVSDDIKLLCELFEGIGMGDSLSEYNRISSYSRLVEIQCEKARTDTEELCRLYKSLGALGGIFICIFLL